MVLPLNKAGGLSARLDHFISFPSDALQIQDIIEKVTENQTAHLQYKKRFVFESPSGFVYPVNHQTTLITASPYCLLTDLTFRMKQHMPC